MNGFWWNCVLTIAWVAMTGQVTVANTVIGFLIGTGILMLAGRAIGAPGYVQTVSAVVVLALAFLRDLVIANLAVARDILRRQSQLRPGIIGVPLDAKTDGEITTFANLLTLTPGSTSLDVSEDRSTLYLHVVYLDPKGPDATREQVKEVEARVLKVTR